VPPYPSHVRFTRYAKDHQRRVLRIADPQLGGIMLFEHVERAGCDAIFLDAALFSE
jgi:hypothetical protein